MTPKNKKKMISTIARNRRLRAACAALRANKRRAFEIMREANGGRCCLCVMQDLACDEGWIDRDKHAITNSNFKPMPVQAFAEAYGLKTVDLKLIVPEHLLTKNIREGAKPNELKNGIKAWELNDEYRMPHAQIAECIEHTYKLGTAKQ